jgi:hypothetical protein
MLDGIKASKPNARCSGRLRFRAITEGAKLMGKASKRKAVLAASDFRRIALSLPEAIEGSHFGQADFRVGGKIFATLAVEAEGYGVLLLAADQQAGMVEDEPEIFSPVSGGWGRNGATRVRLDKVTEDILEAALRTAWLRKAPKRLSGKNSLL